MGFYFPLLEFNLDMATFILKCFTLTLELKF